MRAIVDLVHGRLDEVTAHLAVTDAYLASVPEDRRHRPRTTIASLNLSLARRRSNLADVMRHAEFLTAPPGGESNEEIALSGDLRVMARAAA